MDIVGRKIWIAMIVLLCAVRLHAEGSVVTASDTTQPLQAQSESTIIPISALWEGYGVEHENVLMVRYGGLWQQDMYLSPLLYSGMRVGIGNEWWQVFRRSRERAWGDTQRVGGRWGHVGKVDGQFGWTYSSAMTNVVYSLGVAGGWGAYYDWTFYKSGVELLVGPYLDFDWLGKLHGSSVNKPYSMDVALDLCAMAGVRWSFHGRKTSYRLQYLARVNMVGVDFLPDYWQSYYELSEGVKGDVRCTSLTNHRMLRHALTLDMQFKRSTWRVGVEHEYLEYGKKEMMFSREQVSVVVGCMWHYRVNPSKSLSVWR